MQKMNFTPFFKKIGDRKQICLFFQSRYQRSYCFSLVLFMFVLLMSWPCRTEAFQASVKTQAPVTEVPQDVQKERDHILSLLTLAFVHNDWQTASSSVRGHNIGSVLADENGMPVFWTRNSVKKLNNSSQHGEVRLATKYLSNQVETKYMPRGYTLYTTLEPCAMCTGMLSMIETQRVVFVQQDPEFGHVVDALNSIKYPRVYKVVTPNDMSQKKLLEQGYNNYKKKGGTSITDYLLTPEAEAIYATAKNDLASYKIKHPENTAVLQAARALSYSKGAELLGETSRTQHVWQIKNGVNISTEAFHPTLFLYYSGWNGEKNVAEIHDGIFYICSESGCEESDKLEYLNGTEKWTARLKHGLFEHAKANASTANHQDGIIIYKDWAMKHITGTHQPILMPN